MCYHGDKKLVLVDKEFGGLPSTSSMSKSAKDRFCYSLLIRSMYYNIINVKGSVRKGFYLDKKLFIRNHLKLAKSGSSESRSSFQRSEGGVQYSTKFSDGPRNSQVVSVPSL